MNETSCSALIADIEEEIEAIEELLSAKKHTLDKLQEQMKWYEEHYEKVVE